MKFTKTLGGALALSMIVSAVPQAAEAQRRDRQENRERRNTLIGAGIGLLGGAIVSGGDPWATLGGAAAGGVIGNVTTGDRRDRRDRRWDNRRDRRGRDYDYRR